MISQSLRRNTYRVIGIAFVISIIGHLILFFGIPFLSPSLPLINVDETSIATRLLELPKKIKLAKAPKKKSLADSNLPNDTGNKEGGQGGAINQQGQAFKLPESSTLFFDAYVDGQKYQTGEIEWLADNDGYRLHINIPYAFIGPFVFESRGSIDAYGLAPTIYWAQRGSNNPRYSRFDREQGGTGKMFFSEKPEYSPDLLPGTQDRFSLMFQFASLLNGDSKIDEADSIRAIPVVDYNTLEMWQFKSHGETLSDEIPTLGSTTVRRYTLIQRENDPYKRTVDFWLARDLEWLPGRIRSQEANGRVLELVFKQKGPVRPG